MGPFIVISSWISSICLGIETFWTGILTWHRRNVGKANRLEFRIWRIAQTTKPSDVPRYCLEKQDYD